MKVIKPQKLSIVTRCFENQRQSYLGIGVLTLHHFSRALSSEMDMWKFLAEELGGEAAPDAGMPKSRGEFLVTGSAFQTEGEPGATCPVRVGVGTAEKTLNVIGDRFWLSSAKWTDPVPFVQMPVSWERAFGGEGFDDNPVGKGAAEIDSEQGRVRPLPNIEAPGRFVDSPRAKPEPAGFGPIDFVNPRRFHKAGTYDANYLKERFPGFAEDLDWSIFNLAPEDQHLAEFFRGTEPFVVDGMHPTKPRLEGNLPGIAAKCFLAHGQTHLAALREVEMRLTTVWLFPHAERYMLVFHGAGPVAEDDAADVSHGLFALEDLDQPKSAEHYHATLMRRLDPERGSINALRDDELLPLAPELNAASDAGTAEMEELMHTENLGAKYQRARMVREIEEARERVAAMGMDPDVCGPALPPAEDPTPSIEELPDLAEQLLEDADAAKDKAAADRVEREAKLKPMLDKYGLDSEAILAEPDEKVIGPPKYDAQQEHAKIVALAEDCHRKGYPLEELDAYAADPELRQRMFDFQRQMQNSYREIGHHQTRAPRLFGEAATDARTQLLAMVATEDSFEAADFTGVDLSDVMLEGANLEGGFFESANFAGANLRGAKLARTVFAGADLTGADLTGADLSGANLGDAEIKETSLEGVNLQKAVLEKARLTRASLKDANLTDAELEGATFSETDASGAQLAKSTFIDADLRGLDLSRAELTGASFIKGNLSGVDLSGAQLEGVTFLEIVGVEANFTGAHLVNARFVQGCAFSGADFTNANLEHANLRGTQLRGSNFSGADLTATDLSNCDLEQSTLPRISARDSMFSRANLTDASLVRADLMNAILQKANLTRADLRGANLYQADLALVRSEGGTLLDGANSNKMRVNPVWEPPA